MENVQIAKGAHQTREAGMCVMELVAFFANEPHSDAPQCACPIITRFAQCLNDCLDDAHRQLLAPLVPALALSRVGPEVERKRMFLAADFAVRRWAPFALEARGRAAAAASLRACEPIVDAATARKGRAAAYASYAADASASVAAASAAAADVAAAYVADVAAAYVAAAYVAAAYVADVAAAYVADDAARQDWLAAQGMECLEAMLAITA